MNILIEDRVRQYQIALTKKAQELNDAKKSLANIKLQNSHLLVELEEVKAELDLLKTTDNPVAQNQRNPKPKRRTRRKTTKSSNAGGSENVEPNSN